MPSIRAVVSRAAQFSALVLLTTMACKEVVGPEDSAVAIEVVSGDNQAGRVSATLDEEVVIRVTDRRGLGVEKANVLFRPDSGSGTVNPVVATTDSTGVASVAWRLGATLGAMSMTVSFADVAPVTVTATTVADRISIESGDQQQARVSGTLRDQLIVKVTDFLGRVVQGVPVTFTPDAGSGTTSPAVIATDVNGLARTTWTLGGTASAMEVEASIATGTTPVQFAAVANQDVMAVASGNLQGARATTTLPRPVQVRVTDQNGVLIPNVIVTFTPGTGSGTVSPSSAQTNALGIATTNWTLGATVGTQTLVASSSFSAPINVTAQGLAPSDLAIVSGNLQLARVGAAVPSPLVVVVTDAAGTRVPGANVSFVPSAGNGSVSAATVVTDTLGRAQTLWTLGNTIGAMSLRAISGIDTVTFTATTGADRISISGGNAQSARIGTALANPISVLVRDINDAVVPGAPVTFTPAGGSGTVSPTTVTTDASGIARTIWTLGATPSAMRLTVTVPTAVQSAEVTATATVDSSLVLSIVAGDAQAGTITSALATPLAVRLLDRFGTPVAGSTINWSGTNGVTFSSPTSRTNASGDATVTVTTGNALGSATATATVAGRSETVTFALSNQARFTSVYVGNYFSCGLAERGEAYCWGINQNGQLGDGITSTRTNAPIEPVKVGGAVTLFREISAGDNHACATTIGRQQVCWGVGNGNYGSTTPTVTRFDTYSVIADVAVGSGHSCTVEVGGVTWCVGDNGYGQLGTDTTGAANPAPHLPLPERYTSVAAGEQHSCGMVLNSTTMRCWGRNIEGQLGDGTNLPREVPTIVSGGVTWNPLTLTAGGNFTCGLNNAGAAQCFGQNSFGQLGDGTTTNSNAPVAVSGGLTLRAIVAGRNHACAIQASDSTAYCWGRNDAGQLGDGTTMQRSSPTLVPGGLKFTSLSAGEFHTCGVAATASGANNTLATAGTMYCWGDSEYGQAGTGVYRSNNSPLLVPTRVSNQP